MKRLTHFISLLAIAVLLSVSGAMAQSVPDEGAVDQYGTDQYSSTDQSTPTQTVTNELHVRLVTVEIMPWGFWRANLPVEPGTTVRWLNFDDKPHTVTADDGSFDSGMLQSGEYFDFTFDELGRWHYHDANSMMTGSVIVREPTPTPPADEPTQPTEDSTAQPVDDTAIQPTGAATA